VLGPNLTNVNKQPEGEAVFDIRRSLSSARMLVHGWVSLFVLLSFGIAIHVFQNATPITAAQTVADARVQGGALVIAGGGYVTPEVRQRFFELAGGQNARIVVIPAIEPAPGTEETWLAPWRKVGATHVELCNAHDRATANSPEFCAALNQATGVWFSGGYQDFLASRYVDTAAQQCLHDVLQRNGVVGGCSAGAAILSRVMIQEGENLPIEARGLDLIPDAVVDQHFLQRNRLWRMQQMLETHPNLVGLGIDENTALIYEVRSERLSVLGESYALVCVPPSTTHSARTEVLHAGDNVLLNQLRHKHLAYQPPAPAGSQTQKIALHSA
jgi:cyanophycinase